METKDPFGTIKKQFTKMKFNYIKKIIFIRNHRISKKVHLTIPNNLHEIIIGSLLGDLTAERRNIKSNTRLQFKQSLMNKEYIYHMYNLFQIYCGTSPLNIYKFDSRVNKNNTYYAIKFQTLSLPCFNIYKKLFYNSEGKKILPTNIEDLLTVRGLAY
jgi:hypothetical protein